MKKKLKRNYSNTTILIFYFANLFLCSCNTNPDQTTTENKLANDIFFNSSSFKQIFENSFNELTSSIDNAERSTIIELYIEPIDNYDTIVAIKNCPPFSVRNLVGVKDYKNTKVYLYCRENLISKFSELVDLSGDKNKKVSLMPILGDFECIYEKSFELRDNKLIPRIYKDGVRIN